MTPNRVVHLAIVGLAVLLVLIASATGIYSVPAESEGVVLRLGRLLETVSPGLHYKIPFGVDRVEIVPVKRQLKQEFGFGTSDASNRWQSSPSREWEAEKAMVTGDLNAALV